VIVDVARFPMSIHRNRARLRGRAASFQHILDAALLTRLEARCVSLTDTCAGNLRR